MKKILILLLLLYARPLYAQTTIAPSILEGAYIAPSKDLCINDNDFYALSNYQPILLKTDTTEKSMIYTFRDTSGETAMEIITQEYTLGIRLYSDSTGKLLVPTTFILKQSGNQLCLKETNEKIPLQADLDALMRRVTFILEKSK